MVDKKSETSLMRHSEQKCITCEPYNICAAHSFKINVILDFVLGVFVDGMFYKALEFMVSENV